MLIIKSDTYRPIDSNAAKTLVLGMFDGVHMGHQRLLEEARKYGQYTIVTFENHPAEILDKPVPPALTTIEERLKRLSEFAPEVIWLRRFTKELSRQDWRDYTKHLIDSFSPERIITGYDHTFGEKASGTASKLAEELSGKVQVIIIPPVECEGKPVSSTRIRELIRSGDIEEANILLGKPFEITGLVETGKRIGTELGFKTANVRPPQKIIPKNGVYIAIAETLGKRYKAIVNVGVRPTVSGEGLTIEAHLIDKSDTGALYGNMMTVLFLSWVRPEMKFSGLAELKEQIGRDVDAALEYFVRNPLG